MVETSSGRWYFIEVGRRKLGYTDFTGINERRYRTKKDHIRMYIM